MFTSIEINNLKCLGEFSKPLGALTLLTGTNAAGKSSVIQALAMLRQTALENEWSRSFHLNGSSVKLGTMYDVIDRNSGGSGFQIGVKTNSWHCKWETTSKDRKRDLTAPLSRLIFGAPELDLDWNAEQIAERSLRRLVPEVASDINPQLSADLRDNLASICYVGAERIGPREVYSALTPQPYPDVGSCGEMTPWCLELYGDFPINPGLSLPGVPEFVRHTVQAWMAQLFPGFQLELKRVDSANLITMGVRTSPRGDFYRPTNVGFGLSHVLPIFTACIAALPGRMVIVENPESHLHPAGQSLIGYFLALSASAGVQMLVETHSDHVLNGMRRAIRDRKINSSGTKIYFFNSSTDSKGEPATQVQDVPVDLGGKLKFWPAGFFDQMERDLDYIFRE
jgi:predicted ATPase